MSHEDVTPGFIGKEFLLQEGVWQSVELPYQTEAFSDLNENFFKFTKFIRVSLMINYDQDVNPDSEEIFNFQDIYFSAT